MTRVTLLGVFVFPAVVFALAYFPIVSQLSMGLVSPYAKADVRKRLYAAAIDGMLVVTTVLLYQRLDSLVFPIAGALYLLCRDGVRGQSVGKFFCGLVVISLETGLPATLGSSVRRNALFLLPGANVVAFFLETMTIVRDVQGQRLGDRLAQTHVVEGLGAKDLVSALQRWWQSILPGIVRSGRPKRATIGYGRR
jgi:hypothetical protein